MLLASGEPRRRRDGAPIDAAEIASHPATRDIEAKPERRMERSPPTEE
jgi:hypothetical protein